MSNQQSIWTENVLHMYFRKVFRQEIITYWNFISWDGFSTHKCSARISGHCFSCFSPVCQRHGVRFVPQEVFLAASDLARAHTVGFGSVISLDKPMVSVHSVGPVGVIWFVLRLSVPMLWLCLICVTVSFWSLSRAPYWMGVMFGWFPRPVHIYFTSVGCFDFLPESYTLTWFAV